MHLKMYVAVPIYMLCGSRTVDETRQVEKQESHEGTERQGHPEEVPAPLHRVLPFEEMIN